VVDHPSAPTYEANGLGLSRWDRASKDIKLLAQVQIRHWGCSRASGDAGAGGDENCDLPFSHYSPLGLTPELSRAAKRRRLGRIASNQLPTSARSFSYSAASASSVSPTRNRAGLMA
jgi:hypothetical protein